VSGQRDKKELISLGGSRGQELQEKLFDTMSSKTAFWLCASERSETRYDRERPSLLAEQPRDDGRIHATKMCNKIG
jgi:hypothetical protein